MSAKTLMIQGTGSGVGKSLIAAALCRIFSDMGLRVAPFKAQNMALNSYITADGGEIGRAQALQAEASRIAPTVDMNPILLKATGEASSQVIIQGKVHSNMKAQEYYAFKKEAWQAVTESFDRLKQQFELIILEGAGSPAEINLMDADIVNMAMAKYARAPVILVGDIDKGGVFASLYGTVRLLGHGKKYIKAFIINKFRGDLEILRPGLEMIRQKTNRPVIGVLPYVKSIGLPEEDGTFVVPRFIGAVVPQFIGEKSVTIKIVVIRLPYISNFSDFDPFLCEKDIELIYSQNPGDIENADLVIIPGTKNTLKDLLFLKENRLDESIKRAYAKGIQIIGLCGGYQMLGKEIRDPQGVESSHKMMDGLGLLNIETVFNKCKITCQTEAVIARQGIFASHCETGCAEAISTVEIASAIHQPRNDVGGKLTGYEIHMGVSHGDIGLFELTRLPLPSPKVLDGSINGNCWGTYLHGIFENDRFRRGLINNIRRQKGLAVLPETVSYAKVKEQAIDRLAKMFKEHVDLDYVKKMVRL